MHGEAVGRVVEGHALAAAGRVRHVVDGRGLDLGRQDLGRALQLLEGVDGERGAAELGLGGGLDAEDKGLDAVAPEVGAVPRALRLEEAKVLHELARGVDFLGLVLVVDVRDAGELDLAGGLVRHGGQRWFFFWVARDEHFPVDNYPVLNLGKRGIRDEDELIRSTHETNFFRCVFLGSWKKL